MIKRDDFYLEQYGHDRYAVVVTAKAPRRRYNLITSLNSVSGRFSPGTQFNLDDESLFILSWQAVKAVSNVLQLKGISDYPLNQKSA